MPTLRLDLIPSDLCGPMLSSTPKWSQLFLLLVDSYSWFMWFELLSSKRDIASAINKVKVVAENQSSCCLRMFHTDNGGKITSCKCCA
jgi:hypothetical protein